MDLWRYAYDLTFSPKDGVLRQDSIKGLCCNLVKLVRKRAELIGLTMIALGMVPVIHCKKMATHHFNPWLYDYNVAAAVGILVCGAGIVVILFIHNLGVDSKVQ